MEWGLGTIVVGSALAIGSVHTEVLCVVATLLMVVLGASWWGAKPTRARWPATLVLGVGVGLVAWTAIQLVPLPKGLLEVIAPANAEIWDRALTPLREDGPPHPTMSLDPNATRVALLRGAVLVLTFVCALRVAARREGVRFLERTVVASAALVGVAAVIHPALGLERVFGVFRPDSASFGTDIAPLLNRNHLSAYLNMGSCVALAMSLGRGSRIPRIVPATIFLLLIATQIWLASRGGVVAMVVGALAVLGLARRADEHRVLPWKLIVPGGLVVASASALVLGMKARAMSDLTSRDTVKLDIIRRSLAVLSDFRWVGTGRGAFESVYPAYRTDFEGNIAFQHPESIGLQWAVEWGAPVGIAALGLLAWALRPTSALARSTVPIGPAAAIVALFVHNLLDFNLEVPGVAIAVAVCAACVVGGEADVDRDRAPAWWTQSPRVLVAVLGGAAALVIVSAWTGRRNELIDDRSAMRSLAIEGTTSKATFAEAARAAMLRHPADPYLALMGGVRAARVRDESAIPWLGKAIERASVYGRAHLLLARELAKRSPAQARLEYRLAMEQDYNLVNVAVAEGARLVETPYDALQLVPGGKGTEAAIEALATALRTRVPDAADRLDEELASRNPDSVPLARASVERAMAALETKQAPCAQGRDACLQTISVRIAKLQQVAPRACETHVLVARYELALGDEVHAMSKLERATEESEQPSTCLRFAAERAALAKDHEKVVALLDRLIGADCTNDDACAAAHLHAIGVTEGLGDLQRALRYAKRGMERLPNDTRLMAQVARISAASGFHGDALALYRKLVRREPDNPAFKEALQNEEAATDAARGRALGIEHPR
jgi:tetratricopeptide (TPR) repeat protein